MIFIEIEGLDRLIEKFEQAANGEFQNQFKEWLNAMGIEFLDIVRDEILEREIVDFRRLINSFNVGTKDNVYIFSGSGIEFQLEVGTNVEYASYINDGYPLVTEDSASGRFNDGTLYRFVPGEFEGDRFRYIQGHNTGMILKERFIEARPYFDDANVIFRALFEASLERRVQQWLDDFFD